ncbi:hypothetical protein [Virgisporangium aliadipatigenens]|uniref:hypothetical protein n=1 Tax=Virgisporangium aliadipatigenens TaxID=741659 RepID=UPI00194456E5|nr:hypothetical protein [Virgisporangium aliadipatigenens]
MGVSRDALEAVVHTVVPAYLLVVAVMVLSSRDRAGQWSAMGAGRWPPWPSCRC